MNVCPNCNAELKNDNATFCRSCGYRLKDNTDSEPVQESVAPLFPEETNNSFTDSSETNSKLFFSPDETLVYVLNQKYYDEYMRKGNIKKEAFAAISNKRVYFRGKYPIYTESALATRKIEQSQTVDLCDITSVESRVSKIPAFLVLSILSAIAAAISLWLNIGIQQGIQYILMLFMLVFLILYITTTTKTVIIKFAGGGACLDAKKSSVSQVNEFQKQLFLAKDGAVRKKYTSKNY